MKQIGRFILFLLSLGFLGGMASVLLVSAVIYKYSQSLPEFTSLKDYKPPVVTRVHAGDGRFLAEFAQEKRIFVPITEIPRRLIDSFTAAEDQNFYTHKGVDITAVARAIVVNLKNHGQGKRPIGASTITQQVAKNMLLTNELSYERKIREAIIAYRLEKAFNKDRIMELYLNQIFLGQRSYGVAAAALHYFGKPLPDLTVAECAFLAALPKAPNNYNPVTKHAEAVERRNWVIDRMLEDAHISAAEATEAKEAPLVTVPEKDENTEEADVVDAPYFAEEVRRILQRKYGDDGLYRGGLSVRTALDPKLQKIAETSLRNGLIAYDRRHGWRGPLARGLSTSEASSALKTVPVPAGMIPGWSLALVSDGSGKIETVDGQTGTLQKDDVDWAGNIPLKKGDAVLVESVPADKEKNIPAGTYRLRQIPQVQGALVAMAPDTGRVLAMQGGWKSDGNAFNRATQAKRQPGSAFKPLVYLAALDKGYTPSSIIMDTPVTFVDTAGNVWKPENYHGDFLGPTPLRVGVEKSRNLMTIHLAQQIGIKTVVEYAKRFGIDDHMPANLSNVLGADETTLLQLTTAYGMIVNGGKRITPSFIDRIQDRDGQTIERTDSRRCDGCGTLIKWENQSAPDIPDNREQIADPRTAYQMVSILEGVVQRGTAKALADLNRPLAGKTGTTNDSKDAWFIGFTPDLVVGVFIGFDEPKSLGKKETGASAAVPVFKEFMQTALEGVPPTPFRVPQGVRMVQVNARNGRPTYAGDPDAIWEPFIAGTEPDTNYTVPSYNAGTETGGIGVDTGNGASVSEPLPADTLLSPNPDNTPATASTTEGTGGVY